MMPRAFLRETVTAGQRIQLTGEQGRHYARSLRVQPGEPLPVVAGRQAWLCTVQTADPRAGTVDLLVQHPLPPHDPIYKVCLLQALPKGDKMDAIVQKATEVGVAGICVFGSQRSVARLAADKASAKVERWRRIAQEAASQSQRDAVPDVAYLPSARDAAGWLAEHGIKRVLLLDEGEQARGLRDVLRAHPPAHVALVVGPEGGWDPAERAWWTGCAGAEAVTLGPRILRTETAGPVVAAVVLYEYEDFGQAVLS